MNPRDVVVTFAAAVLAVVVGWFAGAAARDVFGDSYDTAVGVVAANAGTPVESASPSPSPTEEQTPSATPSPTATSTPATPAPTPTVPAPTDDRGFCQGPPPGPGCQCDLEDGEWTWICPLEPESEMRRGNGP